MLRREIVVHTALFSLLLLGVVLAASLNTRTAHAASIQPSLVNTINVGLNVDCAHASTSTEAQNWLKSHHLCAYAPQIRPYNWITSGNCGTLSLRLNNRGGGYMAWTGEMTSSQGPFVAAHYNAYWQHPGGGLHTFGRTGGFSSDWIDGFTTYTGRGFIDGEITSAWDTPVFGILCTSNSPVNNFVVIS